jgi:hyperosmotically inducible protein
LKIYESCEFLSSLKKEQTMKSMKITLATTFFVIGTLLAPVVAHSADATTEGKHAMTYVKDSVITTKVKAKLAEEKMASLVHVTVNTDAKGAVYLSGNVKSQQEADKAVSIARGTEGVTSVTSELKIKKD